MPVCEAVYSRQVILVADHTPYSPDLAPYDFCLFSEVKSALREHFQTVEKVCIKYIIFWKTCNGLLSPYRLEKTICLEKEKRLYPRKILEGTYIKENEQRSMNLNNGIGVSLLYGKGKEAWLKRDNQTI